MRGSPHRCAALRVEERAHGAAHLKNVAGGRRVHHRACVCRRSAALPTAFPLRASKGRASDAKSCASMRGAGLRIARRDFASRARASRRRADIFVHTRGKPRERPARGFVFAPIGPPRLDFVSRAPIS
jgi:hypothetical protein